MLRILTLILAAFLTQGSLAFYLDWSDSFFKSETFYFHHLGDSSQSNDIFMQHDLSLKSTARISDGLLVTSRTALYVETDSSLNMVNARRKKISKSSFLDQKILIEASYFYGTYVGSFFKVDFGRWPLDFGLGITYSGGKNISDVAYDVRDGFSIEIQTGAISIKPYLMIQDANSLEGALQAKYQDDHWGAEIFYNTSINQPFLKNFDDQLLNYESTANLYGYFDFEPYMLAFEIGSALNDFKPVGMAGVFELSWKTPFYSTLFQLIGGYLANSRLFQDKAGPSYVIHPNYNPTFIFWDFFPREAKTDGLSDCAFVTLAATAPIQESFWNIKLYATAIGSNLNKFKYTGSETVVATIYDNQKGFTWTNKLGFLRTGRNHVGFSTQFATQFK